MTGEPWSVEIERRADRDIRRLDRQVRERVLKAIAQLAADPAKAPIRRLEGRPESRLRVGDWRAIFQPDNERHTIVIKRVLPRGRAYNR